jgi:hypothetical protein
MIIFDSQDQGRNATMTTRTLLASYQHCPKCEDPVPLTGKSELTCWNPACQRILTLVQDRVIPMTPLFFDEESKRWKLEDFSHHVA